MSIITIGRIYLCLIVVSSVYSLCTHDSNTISYFLSMLSILWALSISTINLNKSVI